MKAPRFLPVLTLLLGVALPLAAGEFAVLKSETEVARKELVTMVLYREKRTPEQQKLVKDTANAVSAHLAKLKAPAGRGPQFKELKETWEAFKHTRETELVPAILAGEKEKAEKIAAGIQKVRLERCYALMLELDK
jgi:hypothetical protein